MTAETGGNPPRPPTERELAETAIAIIDVARTVPPVGDGEHTLQAVGRAVLGDGPGRPADPPLVMAMAGVLVGIHADRLNDLEGTLRAGRDSLAWGVANGTTTDRQANIGRTILQLADRGVPSMRQLRRAADWVEARGLFDAAEAVELAGGLIAYLVSPPYAGGLTDLDVLQTNFMRWLNEQDDKEDQR